MWVKNITDFGRFCNLNIPFPNISHLKYFTDLILGKGFCIFIVFHFPDSSPSVLNGVHFYFSLRDSASRELNRGLYPSFSVMHSMYFPSLHFPSRSSTHFTVRSLPPFFSICFFINSSISKFCHLCSGTVPSHACLLTPRKGTRRSHLSYGGLWYKYPQLRVYRQDHR